MSDVLTVTDIKRAIRMLRERDRLASEESTDPRCTYCGERASFHFRVHPNADPELVATYLAGGGLFCPPGPRQMQNPIHAAGLIPLVQDGEPHV